MRIRDWSSDVCSSDPQRQVVDQLAALVEEGGVVFVGFHDELASATDPRGDAAILRHTADQETRLAAGGLQQEGEDRGGRGLAGGDGDGKRVAAGRRGPRKPRRARHGGQAGRENEENEEET